MNGMRICLISDVDTNIASVSMDVHVGHFSNPDDIPGLAHYCEHMLFMGNEKYPAEDDFDKFLCEHGGESNASTSYQHTNFNFDVSAEYLEEALDRFAQFFLCPLFSESAIERELNAVNCEYLEEMTEDDMRILYAELVTMSPQHPYCRFKTGNRETLLDILKTKGQDTREELLKFHNKYYSSNIMALAVLGNKSLEKMADIIVPLFGQVEDKSVPIPIWKESPIREEDKRLLIKVVPVGDVCQLSLTWPVEECMYCSSKYLTYLLENTGPHSLCSELISRGWAHSLSSTETGPLGFSFFNIKINLTNNGMEYKDDVIAMVFQYINLIGKEGVQKWIQDEYYNMSKIAFCFKNQGNRLSYVKYIAEVLHAISTVPNVTAKSLLEERYMRNKCESSLIIRLIEELTPRNVRVTAVGKELETTNVEPWYGASYSVSSIPEITLQKWEHADLDISFRLPKPNVFIPTELALMPLADSTSVHPIILRETTCTRLWYKQDDFFFLPKAGVSINISNSYNNLDQLSLEENLSMFLTLFEDAMEECSYAADKAHLEYSSGYSTRDKSIALHVDGFSENMLIFVQKIMHKLTNVSASCDGFYRNKELHIKTLESFKAESPVEHSAYYLHSLAAGKLSPQDVP